MRCKKSYELGKKYAEWSFRHGHIVYISFEGALPDIPAGDYAELKESVEFPDQMSYWEGFNNIMHELIKSNNYKKAVEFIPKQEYNEKRQKQPKPKLLEGVILCVGIEKHFQRNKRKRYEKQEKSTGK